MTNAYRTIIVPAVSVETYRTLAATWETGIGMVITPLYTGSELTHYISSGAIDADIAALLDDPASFVAEINGMTGGSMTEVEAQSLRDAMDIAYLPESGGPDAETVDETLARLGLVRYQEEM